MLCGNLLEENETQKEVFHDTQNEGLEGKLRKRIFELERANEEMLREIIRRNQVEKELREKDKETQTLAEETAMLAALGRLISSTLDINEIYEKFGREVQKLIPFTSLVVTLYNSKEDTFRVSYVCGNDPAGWRINDNIPPTGLLLERVMRSRSGLFIQPEAAERVAEDPKIASSPRPRVQSEMAVPLISKNSAIGTFHFRSTKADAYNEQDLLLAERIAQQIAGPVANAELFVATERVSEGLCQECDNAEKIIRPIGAGLAIVSKDYRVFWANDVLKKLAGPLEGRPCHAIFPHQNKSCAQCPSREIFEAGKEKVIQENMLRNGQDGPVWSEIIATPIKGPQGNIVAAMELILPISDRKRMEEALRESEEKYRNLIDEARDGIAIVQDREIKFANRFLSEITGYLIHEAIGRRFTDFIPPDELTRILPRYEKLIAGKETPALYETAIQTKDGQTKKVEINASIITYETKPALLVFIRDITERNTLQRQLNQARKLESVGQLAAGIAHEINTPMQYVGDNTRFLKDSFNEVLNLFKKYWDLSEMAQDSQEAAEFIKENKMEVDRTELEYLLEEIPRAIEQSLEGIDRVTNIVRAMKEFAHPGSKEKAPVDINKAIQNTITVARNEWKYVAEMVKDFDASLPLVPCLAGEFNQVILNLIINASHAIGDVVGEGRGGKGVITITTRHNGNCAEIRIGDTGAGIPREIQSKIFDPFFTTKEVGKGSGQGLTIAHSVIVAQHGGTIDFETEVGKGTTFIIRLPLAEGTRA